MAPTAFNLARKSCAIVGKIASRKVNFSGLPEDVRFSLLLPYQVELISSVQTNLLTA
jgi:hypothetical protein